MQASMTLKYPIRSLARGGLRSLLAIFCIAIGVMALVALESIGFMMHTAVDVNVRDANGGDLRLQSWQLPFNSTDMAYFERLKQQGKIKDYVGAITLVSQLDQHASSQQTFLIHVVDPQHFPITNPLSITNPSDANPAALLTGNQVIASQSFVDGYHKQVGASFAVHTSSNLTYHVKIAGVAPDSTSIMIQDIGRGSLFLSLDEYKMLNLHQPVLYDNVFVTADPTHLAQLEQGFERQFPDARLATPQDLQNQLQTTVDVLSNFLAIAGLLALLIGGIGIVNTMQVLISRRKLEIAMLKTTGYRRRDLYLLFGIETTLLGFIGGVIGTIVALIVIVPVRAFVVQALQIPLPFVLSPQILLGGLLIGIITALIFGLLPIVQGANTRPLSVLRDQAEGRKVISGLTTFGLIALLSVFFCIMATIILNNNLVWGLLSVYGGFLLLGLLCLLFALIVKLISKLPVPERFNLRFGLLLLPGLVLSVALFFILPAAGLLLFFAVLAGGLVVFLPRNWKANMKMALRNFGRRGVRTPITMLSLFVGIFSISLILVMGQDVRDALLNPNGPQFNVATVTQGAETVQLQHALRTIPGLTQTVQRDTVNTVPIALNGRPIQVPTKSGDTQSQRLYSSLTYLLGNADGYDVSHNQLPSDLQNMTIVSGRNLQSSDTDAALLDSQLHDRNNLQLGDTITLLNQDRSLQRTITIVGFYAVKPGRDQDFSSAHDGLTLTTRSIVQALAPGHLDQAVFYLSVKKDQVNRAIDALNLVVPNAQVYNNSSNGDYYNQILTNVTTVLIALASFSMLAGLIIIANSVALAMLERRRELGILKAVGYTSSNLLGTILLENGIVGGVGALCAILVVSLTINPLGHSILDFAFNVSGTTYSVNDLLALGMILGGAAIAMLVAALVAWSALRVRPLEVLRYE